MVEVGHSKWALNVTPNPWLLPHPLLSIHPSVNSFLLGLPHPSGLKPA